ncbi:LytTR family transcriptional regulator [Alteromonas sp. 5E99-2]|uniref:LytR/AlgR family response regulator transcription factor n=1 Tax=Alteromonas sp. 5E99-2 TaxID=2817683 RepID=UPI001A9A1029|nr:LytTR family DNA-binding domain-containing protein [Alteromonas sp. 5E99-2]MBO1256160.1 LytTR family transcriptional regulator [Alteromonas sp. 5E99-2]
METLQYKLQQFDPGIVWLDYNNQISALNSVAMDVLGNLRELALGENILNFHPEKSHEKIKLLLKESRCPMDSPAPVSMMVNAIDRLLMIKVSKMYGEKEVVGTCMIFYDLTDIASGVNSDSLSGNKPLKIRKIPVYKNNRILLIDLKSIVFIKAEGHYCSLYTIDNEYMCNLSMSDLEGTLDIDSFTRVHRSFIVNLDEVNEIERKNKDILLKVKTNKELTIPVGRNQQALVKQYLNLV